MEKEKTSLTFYPRLDWWLAVGAFMALGLLLAAIPALFKDGLGLPATVGGLAGVVLFFLYLYDIFFLTSYRLEADELCINSQLKYYRIPYRSMKSLQFGGLAGLFSWGGRRRFSLSADSLLINLQKGEWKQISLSPQRQKEFLSILLARIDAERSKRAGNGGRA